MDGWRKASLEDSYCIIDQSELAQVFFEALQAWRWE